MGKFKQICDASGTPKQDSLPEVWKEHFPLLAEGMFPEPGRASGTYATPRFSVTLFTEGCALKVVVGSRDFPRKFWATLDGPEAVLEQVEIMLASGKGEWRDSKDEK